MLIQTAPVAKLAISALWAVHSDFSDFLVAFVLHHRNQISTPAERLFERRRLCGAFLAVEHWPPHSLNPKTRERSAQLRPSPSADGPAGRGARPADVTNGCESSHNGKNRL